MCLLVIKMEVFEAIPKKWGNSFGITLPKEIVRKEQICLKKKVKFLVLGTKMNKLRESFGTIKLKKPTQQVMEEIDEGYD